MLTFKKFLREAEKEEIFEILLVFPVTFFDKAVFENPEIKSLNLSDEWERIYNKSNHSMILDKLYGGKLGIKLNKFYKTKLVAVLQEFNPKFYKQILKLHNFIKPLAYSTGVGFEKLDFDTQTIQHGSNFRNRIVTKSKYPISDKILKKFRTVNKSINGTVKSIER